jgi:serine/threonine protein kinase/tetratricopeptide (TPR) repeat protein
MPDPRWERLWELFHAAREQPASERLAWVAASCDDDAELRREVEELLAAEAAAPAALERPAALPAGEDPLLGCRVGPYRVERLLGEGGMGTVYAASQEEPIRRPVALKVIKPGMDTRDVIARFASERQLLALLDHPHIARVFDAGATAEGRPYFVMERIEGEPITDYCDAHRLPIGERLALVLAVCDAVQHAHQKGVLHRDLKPSNVLVAERDGRPSPIVIDFGVAKALRPDLGTATLATEAGHWLGTPEYMSPEQAAGAAVDTRSDLYALGLLLYELLTGRLPFERAPSRISAVERRGRAEAPPRPSLHVARAPAEEAARIAAARRTDPHSLARGLRGDLDWILLKALEKGPERRYETVAALAVDLRRHLAHEPVAASPPSPAYLAGKFLRRHRLGVAAGAVLALGLLAGVVGLTAGLLEARRARAAAEDRRREAESIAGFLESLFGGADPYRDPRGADLSLREVLDRGAAQIAGLEGPPAERAALMDAIGGVYLRLALYEQAEPLLTEALATRRRLFGADRVEVAQTLERLARLAAERGDTEVAESRAAEAVALRRRLLGADDPGVAPSLLELGFVLRLAGRFPVAADALEEVVAMRRRDPAARPGELAAAFDELAAVRTFMGQHAAAEEALREALRLRQEAGVSPLRLADTLERLGVLLIERGRDSEAEAPLEEVVALRRRHLPPRHPALAGALSNLGLALHNRGRYAEAEPLYREALEIDLAGEQREGGGIVVRLNNLGLLALDRGRPPEAEDLFRQALAAQRRLAGDDHPNVAYPLSNLARALHEQGRAAEAEALYRQALTIRRAKLPAGHPSLGHSLTGLGILLTERGDLEEAEALLAEALAIRRRALPAGDWRTGETASALGACLAAGGRPAEAEPLLSEGLATLTGKRGPADRLTRRAAERLASFQGG